MAYLALGAVKASPAQHAGIRPGDVTVQINRTAIGSAGHVARALDYYSLRGPIRTFFERQGPISSTDFVIR